MSIEEITRTCNHEKVAHAAVASLGPRFARRVSETAEDNGLTLSEFVAETVRAFAEFADDAQRRALRAAMCGADQPLLAGLRHILEPSLEGGGEAHRAPNAAGLAAAV
jgi:hypothetical protein